MRRMLFFAISAIALVFLASVVLLDLMGEPEGPLAHPSEPAAEPVRTVEEPPAPALPSAAVAEQLRAPPSAPMPLPPPGALPASGAPPAPAYIRDGTWELQRYLSSRCGAMELRLGDDLRRRGDDAGHDAVLLVEAEPQRDQVVFGQSKLQTQGLTRGSLIACVQLALRGYALPISRLQPGEPVTVQVVIRVGGG